MFGALLDSARLCPNEPSRAADLKGDVDLMDLSSGLSSPCAVPLPSSLVTHPVDSTPDTLSGVLHLSGVQLASLIPPLVTEVQTGLMLHQTLARLESRLAILQNEGPAMGDDELTLHAESIVRMSGRSDVGFLDPLLATGWLQLGSPDKVQRLDGSVPWHLNHCQRGVV